MREWELVDLFSGIGGFSLAAHSLGISTVAFCECEEYPARVLRRHFPGVPVFPDVKELTGDTIGRLLGDGQAVAERAGLEGRGHGEDGARPARRGRLLTAGFPCQDISYAGKGAGLAGERSGLFFEVVRIIDECRARGVGFDFMLLENVAALLTRGADAVLGALADVGYDACWGVVRAADVGAPHRRERVWIVAYPQGTADGARIAARVLGGLTPFSGTTYPTVHGTAGTNGPSGCELGYAVNHGVVWQPGQGWPTPSGASDGHQSSNGAGMDGGAFARQMLDEALGVEGRKELMGSLNPDWVDSLMGYPIGYTRPEGEPLLWLPNAWPAGDWPTPCGTDGLGARNATCDRPNGSGQHHGGVTLTDALILRGGMAHPQEHMRQTWPAGLGAEQYDWEPPRLTGEKTHRASRLKADGNSIVPQVARLWLAAIVAEGGDPCSR